MKFFVARKTFEIFHDFGRQSFIFKGTMMCVDTVSDLPLAYSSDEWHDYWEEISLK